MLKHLLRAILDKNTLLDITVQCNKIIPSTHYITPGPDSYTDSHAVSIVLLACNTRNTISNREQSKHATHTTIKEVTNLKLQNVEESQNHYRVS